MMKNYRELMEVNMDAIVQKGKELFTKAASGPLGREFDLRLYPDGKLELFEHAESASCPKGDFRVIMALETFDVFQEEEIEEKESLEPAERERIIDNYVRDNAEEWAVTSYLMATGAVGEF